MLTLAYFLFTPHPPLFTAHDSSFLFCHTSLFTTYSLQFTSHFSLITPHYSLVTIPHPSLLSLQCSIIIHLCLIRIPHYFFSQYWLSPKHICYKRVTAAATLRRSSVTHESFSSNSVKQKIFYDMCVAGAHSSSLTLHCSLIIICSSFLTFHSFTSYSSQFTSHSSLLISHLSIFIG